MAFARSPALQAIMPFPAISGERAGIDRIGRGAQERDAIVITEIPFQVNKARLLERIAELVNEKKLEGIADLRDESDRSGMRIVVELKRDAVPQVVLNKLYKLTPMQSSFGVINLAIVNGQHNNGPVAKFKVQQAAAEGKIRFLIGTSGSMGEGMNLQVHTTDGHFVDGAWNPAILEQRGGRYHRQGSKQLSVRTHRYLVSGTVDAKMYDLAAMKDAWNIELWLGEADEIVDFDEDDRNFQGLADTAAIPQSTLDYYRARRAAGTSLEAVKAAQEVIAKKDARIAEIDQEIEYRRGKIKEYSEKIARGEGTDQDRNRVEGHTENIAKLEQFRERFDSERRQLAEHIEALRRENEAAMQYIAAYEDAKKEGRPVEEVERERGLPGPQGQPGNEKSWFGGGAARQRTLPGGGEGTEEAGYEAPSAQAAPGAERPERMEEPPSVPEREERAEEEEAVRYPLKAPERREEPGNAFLGTLRLTPQEQAELNAGRIPDTVRAELKARTVEGLAAVLAEVGRHRQLIVFTHDTRLSDALRRLGLPADIRTINRDAMSNVWLAEGAS